MNRPWVMALLLLAPWPAAQAEPSAELPDGHAATLERERPTLAEAIRLVVVRAEVPDATNVVLDLVPTGGVPGRVALRDDGAAPDESPGDDVYGALAPLGQRPVRVVLNVDGQLAEAGPVAWPAGEERRVLRLAWDEGRLTAEAGVGVGSKMRGDGTGVRGPELQDTEPDAPGEAASVAASPDPQPGGPIPEDADIARHAGWVSLAWAAIVTLWCVGLGLTWALRRR